MGSDLGVAAVVAVGSVVGAATASVCCAVVVVTVWLAPAPQAATKNPITARIRT